MDTGTQELSGELKRRIKEMVFRQTATLEEKLAKLFPRQRRFVEEWAIDLNENRAMKAVGYCHKHKGNGYSVAPRVRDAMNTILRDLSERSRLTGEYVRDYIQSVMEVCPTDYFRPALGGGWLLEEQDYAALPQHVKRLIEEIEYRYVNGTLYMAVKLVSKSAALAMAARYTLTQKIDATVSQIPWDQIAEEAKRAARKEAEEDPVEARILEYNGGSNGVQGSHGAEESPVA